MKKLEILILVILSAPLTALIIMLTDKKTYIESLKISFLISILIYVVSFVLIPLITSFVNHIFIKK
jgi:hypothetical protein